MGRYEIGDLFVLKGTDMMFKLVNRDNSRLCYKMEFVPTERFTTKDLPDNMKLSGSYWVDKHLRENGNVFEEFPHNFKKGDKVIGKVDSNSTDGHFYYITNSDIICEVTEVDGVHIRVKVIEAVEGVELNPSQKNALKYHQTWRVRAERFEHYIPKPKLVFATSGHAVIETRAKSLNDRKIKNNDIVVVARAFTTGAETGLDYTGRIGRVICKDKACAEVELSNGEVHLLPIACLKILEGIETDLYQAYNVEDSIMGHLTTAIEKIEESNWESAENHLLDVVCLAQLISDEYHEECAYHFEDVAGYDVEVKDITKMIKLLYRR